MRKFIEALKEKEIAVKSVSLPFTPMHRVISNNPKIIIGIRGVRHIQRTGGLSIWPVFYISKDQVMFLSEGKKVRYQFFSMFQYNDNNKSHNTKVLRVNFPLHKLDEMTEGLLELCQGLGFELYHSVVPAAQKN